MILKVVDQRVWSTIRWLYIGAGLLFLATISLGILNVFTPGTIPRGQILAHFHGATIGWVTLSVIATTFWVYTGDRVVSTRYVHFVQAITIIGLITVAGYIEAFGLAFNGDGPFWLLPLFGIPAWLVILSTLVFAIRQWKKQTVATSIHLLLLGALIVATLGATMGVIWGLGYETGWRPYPAAGNGLGAHAAPMDMYLALAFAGMVELMLRPGVPTKWTKPALAQMLLGVVGAFFASISLFAGIGPLIPLGLLLYLVSFGFYMGRIGWRTFTVNPFKPGRNASLFWGGAFFPVSILLFVYLVAAFFVPGNEVPHALGVVFVHVTFVGMATNFLLATQSTYADDDGVLRGWQPVAAWILNLGLLAFFAGEYLDGRREGALIMALGALLSLGVVWARLGRSWGPAEPPSPNAPSPPMS